MADLSVTPVSTGIKPQPQMSLGDLMNIAQSAQAYQQAQQLNPVQLQSAQLALKQAQTVNPSLARTAAAQAGTAETGEKLAAGQLPFQLRQSKAQAGTAETQFNSAQLENIQKQTANSSRNLLKLLNSSETITPESLRQQSIDMMKNTGASDAAINQALQNLPTKGTDKEMRAFIARHAANSLSAEAQIEKLFPSAQATNTGASVVPMTMGSPYLAMQPPGSIAGPATELQVPPTTQVVTPIGETKLVGPLSQRGNLPLTTGLNPSAAAANQAPAEFFTKDWTNTQADANNAQQRVGVLQNIRNLSDKAFTGVGGSRKELATGIANAIGINVYEAEKTATDELAKNSTLLALAGGNTDAARALAEAANPNKKMNSQAIKGVVNQLIAGESFKQQKMNVLSQYINDPKAYMQIAQQVNSIDPRVMQEMTTQEVTNLKKSMSPAEQQRMAQQIQLARQLGLIK
jgi:hypothetical protein